MDTQLSSVGRVAASKNCQASGLWIKKGTDLMEPRLKAQANNSVILLECQTDRGAGGDV